MSKKHKKLVIIDGNAIIHRAWHALPPTMTTRDGQMTNAVYGFTSILLKTIKDLKPEYVAVTFDMPGKTFRHEEYPEYKGTREKKEQELYDQIPLIKDVVSAFDIPIYEMSGFEADDIIGTITKEVRNVESVVVTGDNDILQLVDDNTKVYGMKKGITDMMIYDEDEVKRKYDGLVPKQLIDYKGLRGDPSDNLPGVRGIGEKGATSLLNEFKTLENIYKNINSKKISEKNRKLLQEQKKEALLSKKMATIKRDVKFKFELEKTELKPFDINVIVPLFQRLQFKSLLARISNNHETIKSSSGQIPETKDGSKKQSDLFSSKGEEKISRPQAVEDGTVNYMLVDTEKKFDEFFKELQKQKLFAFDIETAGFHPMFDELLGIGFSWKKAEAYYVLIKEEWMKKLKTIFEDKKREKIGQNIKFDIEGLLQADIQVKGKLYDTMIASYLGSPGTRSHSLNAQVFSEFGYQMQPIEDLIGKKGKNQITLNLVDPQRVSDYCCEDADFTLRLLKPTRKILRETNNIKLFEEIEMPLIHTLVEMEKNGIKIDTKFLADMSKELTKKANTIEGKIHTLAGAKFNVASPIQLKEILFDKLKISTEGLSRTKTGISSAAAELEKMKDKHKIIPLIIEYRELTKLLSTYIDALPKLVFKKTGRVHTSFNQTIAATGRLSSTNPNLQNIPIRTELGQQIRKAFIADRKNRLVAADYSQIELRMAAVLADEKNMLEAFNADRDIHTETAARLNNISSEKVSKEMRRTAKTVNFGILYGMGAFGLSEREGMSFKEAREFIDQYFKTFKNIKKYVEETKEFARKHGYVETLFGRRRYLPEIHSGVQQIRSSAERMAINHPLQGTAADLIKLAMIKVHQKLHTLSPESKMLLQVHDELVFEVPEQDVLKVSKEIKKIMENVHTFSVPIKVDVKSGNTWGSLQ